MVAQIVQPPILKVHEEQDIFSWLVSECGIADTTRTCLFQLVRKAAFKNRVKFRHVATVPGDHEGIDVSCQVCVVVLAATDLEPVILVENSVISGVRQRHTHKQVRQLNAASNMNTQDMRGISFHVLIGTHEKLSHRDPLT